MSFSIAALPDPGVVHFYSYATGISLELPVGFEADGEDGTSARYRNDDGTAEPPLVQVRVVGEYSSGGDAGAVRALADGFAERAEFLSRRERPVDDCPAETVVSRSGGRFQHQTALAADGRLIAVVCVTAETSPDDLAAFDTAIDSIRVIPL